MSIYCWGLSKNGQAGPGDKNGKVIIPNKIKIKASHGKIIGISTGGLFTAAITDTNSIISFGCGKYGRLGNGSEIDQSTPFIVKLNGDSLLSSISCGLWHGCVVLANDTVLIWGHAKACGSSTCHNLEPTIVPGFNSCVGVSCGNNYTLGWTREGHAYSWGSNHHGVLGQGTTQLCNTPLQIAALKDGKIIHMSAGFSHCGAVTEEGKVYMWGQGKFGALGLSQDKHDILIPQLVPDLVNIKEISCNVGENHGHTLALSNDGLVFSAGDGYKGKLGLGNQNSYFSFQQIPVENFSGECINHVSAGGIHSSAVSNEGHVFTWGCGSDGRLGHPDAEGHRYLFRSDIPRIVESLTGKAIDVSASYYHTVALLED